MPELQPLSCSNCAAPLADDDPTDDFITCEYCGQVHKFAAAPPVGLLQDESADFLFQPGDAVAVKWGKSWWDATVTEAVGSDSWRVHFDGWSDRWDEVVDRPRIVPRTAPEAKNAIGRKEAVAAQEKVAAEKVAVSYDVGAKVAVKWKSAWYDATIRSVVAPGSYRIHYDGWSSSWDETVDKSRIAARGTNTTAGAGCGWISTVLGFLGVTTVVLFIAFGVFSAVCGGSTVDATGPPVTAETVLAAGDKVHVQWGSSWYLATVLSVAADGTVQIHYEGFDDSSDEFATRDRLRLLPPAVDP